jgi:hypothetical protein
MATSARMVVGGERSCPFAPCTYIYKKTKRSIKYVKIHLSITLRHPQLGPVPLPGCAKANDVVITSCRSRRRRGPRRSDTGARLPIEVSIQTDGEDPDWPKGEAHRNPSTAEWGKGS